MASVYLLQARGAYHHKQANQRTSGTSHASTSTSDENQISGMIKRTMLCANVKKPSKLQCFGNVAACHEERSQDTVICCSTASCPLKTLTQCYGSVRRDWPVKVSIHVYQVGQKLMGAEDLQRNLVSVFRHSRINFTHQQQV